MLINKLPRYEILSEEAVATLDKGWRRIVSELGIEFLHEDALELFRKAGMAVEDKNVKLDPDFLLEQVAKAPREFDLQARNPERTVHIGGDHMVFSPVYGCPFIRSGDERRDATTSLFAGLTVNTGTTIRDLPEHIATSNAAGKPSVRTQTADEIPANIARFAQRTVQIHAAHFTNHGYNMVAPTRNFYFGVPD